MKTPDQKSCETAESSNTKYSPNLVIDGAAVSNEDVAGKVADLEYAHSFPDLVLNVEKHDDEYIKSFLLQRNWYHGMMFGKAAEKLLKWESSYIVRRSMGPTHKFLCITARVEDKYFHFQFNWNSEGWSCPILYEKFPRIPVKRYEHIYQLLDAWSLVVNQLVPISRCSMILQHSSIALENQLGRGAFGEVIKAKYVPMGATVPTEVAVKRLIGDAKRPQLVDFCNEANIMTLLEHKNIVALYGFASLQQPIMLVIEFVPGGDLRKYLQRTPNVPSKQIIKFAMEIASGMKHLSSKNVIHRDLAARNCLITKELNVKISDFGLSVNESETKMKSLKKAPIRWLSPETFSKGLFNEKTDVWSYGVLLTELMTRCAHDPLWPKNLKQVQKWIKESEHPHKIEDGDPSELKEIVDACCAKIPSVRINFREVKNRLAMLQQKKKTLELDAQKPMSPNPAIEKKKSEDRRNNMDRRNKTNRKSHTSTDRTNSNNTLTRKKSRDAGKNDRSNERKNKAKGGNLSVDGTNKSSRRKEQKGAVGISQEMVTK